VSALTTQVRYDTRLSIRIYIYIYIGVYIYTYINTWLWIYAYMFTCICIYLNVYEVGAALSAAEQQVSALTTGAI